MILTVTIFLLTLVLILVRPKGLNEAWFTVAGAAFMLLLGRETPGQALAIVEEGKDALLFLGGLLLLADLMRLSGFFEWAAIHAAKGARGDGIALFRNVFLLGAIVTALLSLDTTAVMLTPVVLAFVARLGFNSKPFLFTCVFVSNSGSLLLQVSNLTNLLFASAFAWSFGGFAARMILPQIFVLALNYLLFRWLFREILPKQFSSAELPEPRDVIPDQRYFRACVWVFSAVVVGYFVGALIHVPPYIFAFVGAAVLFMIGAGLGRVKASFVTEISWSVFPFVIGLFIVVRAMENIGLTSLIGRGVVLGAHSPVLTVLTGVFGAGLGSNFVNNVPMALLSITSLRHGDDLGRYAALIGCNVGPNLTIAGSLATMLVLSAARKQGDNISAKDFLKVGLKTTPFLLAAGALGLLLTAAIFK